MLTCCLLHWITSFTTLKESLTDDHNSPAATPIPMDQEETLILMDLATRVV